MQDPVTSEEEVIRRCGEPGIIADWYDDRGETELGVANRWMAAHGKRVGVIDLRKYEDSSAPYYWGDRTYIPLHDLATWDRDFGPNLLPEDLYLKVLRGSYYRLNEGDCVYSPWAYFRTARDAELALGRALYHAGQ